MYSCILHAPTLNHFKYAKSMKVKRHRMKLLIRGPQLSVLLGWRGMIEGPNRVVWSVRCKSEKDAFVCVFVSVSVFHQKHRHNTHTHT